MILTLILIALDAFLVGMYLLKYLEDNNWAHALIGFLWLAAAVVNIIVAQVQFKQAAAVDTSKPIMVTTEAPIKVDSITTSTNGRTFYLHYFEGDTYKLGNDFIEDLQ